MDNPEYIKAMDLNERFRFFMTHAGLDSFHHGPRAMALAVAEQAIELGPYAFLWAAPHPQPAAEWLTGLAAEDYAGGLLQAHDVTLVKKAYGYEWPIERRAAVMIYVGTQDVQRRVVEAEMALSALTAMEERTPDDATGEMASPDNAALAAGA
jgi:hypothetical protein